MVASEVQPMGQNSLDRLLKKWNGLASAAEGAAEAAGAAQQRHHSAPFELLRAALVAEIVNGVVDPAPAWHRQVISSTGKMIQVHAVETDRGAPAVSAAIDFMGRGCDEIAIVATAGMRPVAIHFMEVRFLEPLARAVGLLDTSPVVSGAFFRLDALTHDALELEPAVAAAWGVRTVRIQERPDGQHEGRDLLRQLQLEYNRWGGLGDDARAVLNRISFLEENGLFRWVDMPVPYHHMAATLTDAILAFGGHYHEFTAPRVAAVLDLYPEAVTTSDLVSLIEGDDGFWRTTEWPNQDKRILMRGTAVRMKALGIETEGDLLTADAGILGPALDLLTKPERTYLLLLSGSAERAAASSPIRRFLEEAGVRQVSKKDDVEIEAIVAEAAAGLGRKVRVTDHSIWRYMGRQLALC
ncbi:MAG: hypothetical protein ACNA8P_13545 [Phycisphaerales bacterium]